MKLMLSAQFIFTLCLSVAANAQNSVKYELTISNGAQMPISPAVIYVKTGGESAAAVGSQPTSGFVQLCQTGNGTLRMTELKSDASIKLVTQTTGPILPGESRVVEVEVMNPQKQSIHLETMYGKSKDICGIGSINSHSLVALKQHVTTEIIQKDNVLVTGAFANPVLPAMDTYLGACALKNDAISCLRELALPVSGKSQIRFFAGYFPSLINALETKYGSDDVQTLLVPTSGAIQFKLKLKH